MTRHRAVRPLGQQQSQIPREPAPRALDQEDGRSLTGRQAADDASNPEAHVIARRWENAFVVMFTVVPPAGPPMTLLPGVGESQMFVPLAQRGRVPSVE